MINSRYVPSFDTSYAHAGAAILVVAVIGCGRSRPPAVQQAEVDAAAASSTAMEQFDANDDGAIDRGESVACPPLTMAFRTFDADGDGKLSTDEISARVERLYGGAALATFNGIVLLSGRPLPNAQVRFRPVALLGDGVQPAAGRTDEAGAVRPTIDAAELPENLQGQPFLRPGLYHVEITHPERALPARYNTATELCAVVDPASRDGLAAQFDLQP